LTRKVETKNEKWRKRFDQTTKRWSKHRRKRAAQTATGRRKRLKSEI
jgi:hypothetical protein